MYLIFEMVLKELCLVRYMIRKYLIRNLCLYKTSLLENRIHVHYTIEKLMDFKLSLISSVEIGRKLNSQNHVV